MLYFLKDKLTNQDLYGHPVELNFNKKGKQHKTLIGGIFSIAVLATYYLFVYTNLKKMFWRESNSVSVDVHMLHESDITNLSVNQTQMTTFFIMSK